MTQEEFLKQQFITLREEIKHTKMRLFIIVLLGTLLVMAASFAADMVDAPSSANGDTFTAPAYYSSLSTAAAPYVLLLLILLYVAEQHAILRCGHYIKEHIEPKVEGALGWERWLESHPRARGLDKAFLGSFLVIFLIYYFVSVGVAAYSLASAFGEAWSMSTALLVLAPYAVGGIWALLVAGRHWHAMTHTSE
jgi:hypothetical protein